MIAFVCIGNSDDKLPQREWAAFQIQIKFAIHETGSAIYGEWHSYPDSTFQNACLCFDIEDDKVPELRGVLAALAVEYRQDSIAWNQVTDTEFLGPRPHLNHEHSDRWTGGDKKADR